jgi:eukaryotic-like serine/threonine-protein kinase
MTHHVKRLMPGTRLGVFQIDALIGVGGMGEVYRATDTRLGRAVAIKVLPDAVARDPDRLARFEREARVLATLNHPNISAIYGIQEAASAMALVLELVEGDTLAERLDRIRSRKARLPIAEAMIVARQIAAALDAAHEKNIIHRDLKPANIKLTAEGAVKILDFGIAEAVQAGGTESIDRMPTAATREVCIVGTAAYMSPEQARGQAVDKRTDIWAFGCVLYEMLTGRLAFEAPTVSDTIARVLGAEPDWAALPAGTPPGLIRLLRRCLERDAKRRLRDLGDLDLALEVSVQRPASGTKRTWPAWAAAAGIVTIAGAGLTFRRSVDNGSASTFPVRFEAPVSVALSRSGSPALSPDGRHVVFAATGADGVRRFWLRSLTTLETQPLSGSEGEVADNTTMFWSPDSRYIGFYSGGKVKKIESVGGAPEEVCEPPAVAVGGSWNRDGVIVLGNSSGGLVQCRASGGTALPVTLVPEGDRSAIHLFPSFLPDGRHLLYLRVQRDKPSLGGLYIADLQRRPNDQSGARLLETGFNGNYVPSRDGSGRILFVRDSSLWAARFDLKSLALVGPSVQVASPIGTFRDGAFFSATERVLIYRGTIPDFQLAWLNRQGRRIGTAGVAGQYTGVALSPDATRAVVLRENRFNRADQDLWLLDLDRDNITRLTSDPLLKSTPAWSADGTAVMLAQGHEPADLWTKPVDGSAGQRLWTHSSTSPFRLNSITTTLSATADGRFLVFSVEGGNNTQGDLWVLALGPGSSPAPLVQQEFDQRYGSVSPDGKWLAYTSNETGANEVFVRPQTMDPATEMPVAGERMMVSRGGGTAPRWRADGQELFYQTSAGALMAVRVSVQGFDEPTELFRAPGMLPHWGVAPDGQRFLLALPVSERAQGPFTVVLDWQSELERR